MTTRTYDELAQIDPLQVIDPQFIIQRSGKDFVLYAGLLGGVHKKGVQSIETTVVQVPSDTNNHFAVVKATVIMKNGERFDGIGDASPASIGNKSIIPHVLRMAETRAKGRAMRDAINVGVTMSEELGGMEEVVETPRSDRPARRAPDLMTAAIGASNNTLPDKAKRPKPEKSAVSFDVPLRDLPSSDWEKFQTRLITKAEAAGVTEAEVLKIACDMYLKDVDPVDIENVYKSLTTNQFIALANDLDKGAAFIAGSAIGA